MTLLHTHNNTESIVYQQQSVRFAHHVRLSCDKEYSFTTSISSKSFKIYKTVVCSSSTTVLQESLHSNLHAHTTRRAFSQRSKCNVSILTYQVPVRTLLPSTRLRSFQRMGGWVSGWVAHLRQRATKQQRKCSPTAARVVLYLPYVVMYREYDITSPRQKGEQGLRRPTDCGLRVRDFFVLHDDHFLRQKYVERAAV